MIKEQVMVQSFLKIHPNDNVLVALKDLKKGTVITYKEQKIAIQQDVPSKHKFFICDLNSGKEVTMYGTLVGKVQCNVSQGELMTTENTKHAAGAYSYKGFNYQWQAPDISKFVDRTFDGYHRSDGRVGTANYWLFIPMVFCENRNLDTIKEALHKELGYAVTEKYKQYAHHLVEAYKKGDRLNGVDLEPETNHHNRVFKNVDGIKFL